MNHLPNEIIAEIVSYLPQESWNLVKYATINKAFWHRVSSLLYKSVKLRETGSTARQLEAAKNVKNGWVTEPIERQRLLLESIAGNPKLGSLVHEFSNDSSDDWTTFPKADAKVLVEAAKNLTQVRILQICYNPLAIQTITTPPWTTTLSSLNVNFFSIEDFIWPPSTITSLRYISWTTPQLYENSYGNTVQSIHEKLLPNMIHILASTCPLLEALDLQATEAACRTRYFDADWNFEQLGIDTNNYKKYDFSMQTPKLQRLNHFGLQRWMYMEDESGQGLEIYRDTITESTAKGPETSEKFMVKFVKAYKDQIRSFTWDLANYPKHDAFLVTILPELTNLTKFHVSGLKDGQKHKDMLGRILTMVSKQSGGTLSELIITGPDGHDILPSGGPPLDREYGSLLANSMKFSNLIHLNISTWVTEDCKNGGYLELDEYSKRVMQWIKLLPPGLEALDIRIDMEDTSIDVVEDDIPELWRAFAQIFVQTNMVRLKKCDVVIKYYGRDGATDTETLVFRRRDAHQRFSADDAHGSEVERILWVWWIGSEYQHCGHNIVRDCSRIKIHAPSDTEFEGGNAPYWTPDPEDFAVLHYGCEECERRLLEAEHYERWQEQILDPHDLYESDDSVSSGN